MLTAGVCKRGLAEDVSEAEARQQCRNEWIIAGTDKPSDCLLSLPQISLLISSFVKWLQRDGPGTMTLPDSPRGMEGREAADSFLQA